MATKKTRRLTRDELLSKPVRTRDLTITFGGEDATVSLKAISNKEYDDLLLAHPPTKQQKEDDEATYNPDSFNPALIAAVLDDPKLTEDEVKALYESEAWSRGELMNLFLACVSICTEGLKADPT